MNWHERYTQQARWTRDLRTYLFDKAGLALANHILEAGCGTGAVLSSIQATVSLHGLDISAAVLREAKVHAPQAHLTQADALNLPYPDYSFDVTFCHYLLLWVKEPLRAVQEMARVTRPGGSVLALAEPDYTQRVDKPASLSQLGKWQTEALRRQGADPTFGARLAETFRRAGIELVETGTIQGSAGGAAPGEWELEWQVLEADLANSIQGAELERLKSLDKQARADGGRTLHVPTYFAWGRV